MAKRLFASARAPFVAAISADCLEEWDEDAIDPAARQSWAALRGMPEAAYLGLTVPRFLLRVPCFMPVLSVKGQPEVRLGGFVSMTGSALAGAWSQPAV